MSAGEAGGNIVLIGFMGVGKSSIGKRIAQRLGFRFVDTDQIIVGKTGSSIAALFQEKGEPFFRDEESAALGSLRDERGHVIATGGGIVDREANAALLQALGFVVWFTASEEVILERVSRNDRRPMLHQGDPKTIIAALLGRRAPAYEAAAHFKIDTSFLPHDEVAAKVAEAARAYFRWP